jgi:hypothetical protein
LKIGSRVRINDDYYTLLENRTGMVVGFIRGRYGEEYVRVQIDGYDYCLLFLKKGLELFSPIRWQEVGF